MESVSTAHSHVFLGAEHDRNARRTWAVIWLSGGMMVIEIGGGLLFGSVALVADGFHMSTHAGAMLLTALAYFYARRYAEDTRFAFGTGKLGDLAAFTSAIVLSAIAVLILCDAISHLASPVRIDFDEAIPIAILGLGVNLVSAWILSGGGHGHSHHLHDHQPHDHHGHDAHSHDDHEHDHHDHRDARSSAAARDHGMRSAYVHVIADGFVSVLAVFGLLAGRFLGWWFMDPVMGLIGSAVILSWAWTLIRDAGAVLLDMTADSALAKAIRRTIEAEEDELLDLHLWRLGPGHLGAILSIATRDARTPEWYKSRLAAFATLSHVTVEISPIRE